MATLIDTNGEVVAETNTLTLDDMVEETPEESQVAPDESPEESEVVETPEEDVLPDKYQGKSATDIARMHQELEKRLGQQSSEVGELRTAFDEMVKNSMAAQQAPTPEVTEVEEVDFFADPKAAMDRAIANNPVMRQMQEATVQLQKEKSLAAIQSKHSDMKDVIGSESFQTWVKGSQFRQNLFAQADQNYDFAAADELLTLYKDTQGVVKSQAAVEKVAKKAELKKASTGSSRSNPEGQTSRKVYRRRDIIELMNRDPKRYEAMQPEIMKAYSEGRVK
jgi:hypothetical protein